MIHILIKLALCDLGNMVITIDQQGNNYVTTIDNSIPKLPFDHVYVIDLVRSGTRAKGASIYHQVLKPILEHTKHTYFETTSPVSIAGFAENFTADNLLVIFILGDTSVNEFINHLPKVDNKRVTIVPIPAGTGNSLALSLGLDSIEKAVNEIFLTSFTQPLYTYNVQYDGENRRFLVVFSWGFHAALVADSDSDELRKHGLDRFKMAAVENLEKPNQYQGDILFETSKVSGPLAYFVVTPAARFEPTFLISPQGDIRNDSLYVVAFQLDVDIMEVMNQVYDNGAHAHNEKVVYQSVRKVVLRHEKKNQGEERFCIDGQIVAIGDGEIVITSAGFVTNGWSLYTS